jgi:hypothetical protein
MDDDSAHRPLPPEGIRLAQAHLWITQQRGGEPDRTRTLLVSGVRAKRLRHRVAGWDAKYPQWACRPLKFPIGYGGRGHPAGMQETGVSCRSGTGILSTWIGSRVRLSLMADTRLTLRCWDDIEVWLQTVADEFPTKEVKPLRGAVRSRPPSISSQPLNFSDAFTRGIPTQERRRNLGLYSDIGNPVRAAKRAWVR